MIYKGTFPQRPDIEGELNVVNQGDTGRGKWARSLVKHGKDAGADRRPALAWQWLANYWDLGMPEEDKTYWKDRAAEHLQDVRPGGKKWVTGYSLFLMANTGPMSLDEGPLRVPLPDVFRHDAMVWIDSVVAKTRKLKVYHWHTWGDIPPEHDFAWWSVIRHQNVYDTDPMKLTHLIAFTTPNTFEPPNGLPDEAIFLTIPWALNPGDWLGVHVVGRRGGQGKFNRFYVSRPTPKIKWLKAS